MEYYKKQIMNYYKKARRMIEQQIIKGKTKFILFPYGERAILIKEILNEQFGIKEECIIDNNLAKYNPLFFTLEHLKDYDLDEYTVLLTSDNPERYSEIRYELMKYARVDQFVDVFSFSMFFDKEVYYEKPHYEHPRYFALEVAVKEIYKNGVPGDIAECGVYRGKFANHMSRLMPDRKIYLFDTFSGFDERDINEEEEIDSGGFRRNRPFNDICVEATLNNIGYRANAIVRKGYFPETAVGLEDKRFAFVSLDTDLYKPIYEGLKFFYPRLNPGGYIFVDDLGHAGLKGVRKAVLDYCLENMIGYVPIFDKMDATAVITKPL